MMARGHALSGAALGLLGCQLAHLGGADVTPATAFTAAAVCAGAALLPDLDHPEASIAQTFGPLSRVASVLTNSASATVYAATKTARDDVRDGGHRGVTHTVAFALLTGGLAGVLALWRPGLMVILFCLLAFALRALIGMRRLNRVFDVFWRWFLRPLLSTRRHPVLARLLRWFLRQDQAWIMLMLGAAAASAWAAYTLPPGQTAWWVGGCVAVGCWAHCLGDSMTRSGCPWLWPVPIGGKRWYPIGMPRALRFHTGKRGETWVTWLLLTPLVVVLAVSTVPGAWTALLTLVRSN
jgi:membrane-bound metal-dependent hydrolase YbcI (DUF457 family)